jgi:uncharacterized protein
MSDAPGGHTVGLVDRVSAAIREAMKAQDRARLVPLRMLKTALTNRSVEKGRPLDEAESQQVVVALIKQRRDSIELFIQGRRQELADKEAAEIVVLEAYLPPPVSADDLARAVDAAIAAHNASSPKDLGRVMKAVMAGLAGRNVDGRTVNDVVRRKLGG